LTDDERILVIRSKCLYNIVDKSGIAEINQYLKELKKIFNHYPTNPSIQFSYLKSLWTLFDRESLEEKLVTFQIIRSLAFNNKNCLFAQEIFAECICEVVQFIEETKIFDLLIEVQELYNENFGAEPFLTFYSKSLGFAVLRLDGRAGTSLERDISRLYELFPEHEVVETTYGISRLTQINKNDILLSEEYVNQVYRIFEKSPERKETQNLLARCYVKFLSFDDEAVANMYLEKLEKLYNLNKENEELLLLYVGALYGAFSYFPSAYTDKAVLKLYDIAKLNPNNDLVLNSAGQALVNLIGMKPLIDSEFYLGKLKLLSETQKGYKEIKVFYVMGLANTFNKQPSDQKVLLIVEIHKICVDLGDSNHEVLDILNRLLSM